LNLEVLGRELGKLPAALKRPAERLLARADDLRARLVAPSTPPRCMKIRCHGDYHLGQVLWQEDDFVILDFEGEPSRPLAERRARHPAMKDVAGMLRSFSYAAYAALFERLDDRERLEPWARSVQSWLSGAFLDGYLAAAGDALFLPTDRTDFTRLLELYILDKAVYELHYELNNRPDWVGIPLSGMLRILGG
jgi:maltose alpha-D-glucosyltransferase/alpha-amylase